MFLNSCTVQHTCTITLEVKFADMSCNVISLLDYYCILQVEAIIMRMLHTDRGLPMKSNRSLFRTGSANAFTGKSIVILCDINSVPILYGFIVIT